MKKNLISIGILALLILNLALTGIMMFSVLNTNKKTAALVTDIATAINLELNDGTEEAAAEETISIADVETYTIPDMTIPLQKGEDGKDHYALLSVSLSMNMKHADYEAYGAGVDAKKDLIKGIIIEVVSQYSIDEAKTDSTKMGYEILSRIQKLYDSDFIFDVTFSSALYQ